MNCGGKECDNHECDDCDTFLQYMKKSKEQNAKPALKLAMRESADIYLFPGGEYVLTGGGSGGGSREEGNEK